MNEAARRSAVFLEAMGIGPLWTLRATHDSAGAQDATQEEAPPAAPPLAAPIDHGPVASAAPAAPEQAHAPAAQPVAAGAAASASAWADDTPPAPPTIEQIAQMDWRALRAAVASCTRCGLCAAGRKPVFGSGAQQAQWMVVAGATSASDEQEGQSVAGEPGKLLANMLAAVQMARDSNVYVSNLIKCRPTSPSGAERAPTSDEARACRPYLERELALCGARTVLTVGQIATNTLLDKPLHEPLAGARGTVHQLGTRDQQPVALVATLHPGELLRRGADKALAWSDLCMARAAHAHDD